MKLPDSLRFLRPRRQQVSKEYRRRQFKHSLITGIPALLLAVACLGFLFHLVHTVHKIENQTLNTSQDQTVQDGDLISIDFVGTIDGKEFSGSNTRGSGEDLLVGSGSYIGTFEEQLIGHHVGETVRVTVTMPEDYVEEEYRSKEAVYDTTINGIYE